MPAPAGDPRLREVLGRALTAGQPPLVSILGFPCDAGVTRNNGRAGAAAGPAAIREALGRLTPDAESAAAFLHVAERTADLGDLEISGDLERDQERLGERIAPLIARERMVIVLGGGHETAYGHFLGYARARVPVRIVNWDAHCDVREPVGGLGTSGTPFRQALNHPSGLARRYCVAGVQPHSAAAAHVAFAASRGEVVWRRDVTRATVVKLYAADEMAVMASFDLDALDRAHAPGVSAPNAAGLPVELWLEAAYRAGAAPDVRSADIVELNPALDRDGQTAALAALTVWYLLKGMSDRIAGAGRPPATAT
jgi:formiminoglutamase